uniref:Uncharacterized protein n=1 Tax=Candidatus Kentrum sp. DK TaxID=2126562 RepID=A0A450RUY8_9GAMM|nr:MAG: hypothetical protein BECKDK2373B_GA0170837_100347 [Candidatus Kentron sp. DK]
MTADRRLRSGLCSLDEADGAAGHGLIAGEGLIERADAIAPAALQSFLMAFLSRFAQRFH